MKSLRNSRPDILLRSIFGWWRAEFVGMLPHGLRRAFGLERDTLVLRFAADHIDAELREGARVRPVATLPFDENGMFALSVANLAALKDTKTRRARVVLMIDKARTIRRRFDLPKAARNEITGALSFEIERQTPFRASEIYLDFEIHAGADDRFNVDTAIVPRKSVDPVLAVLNAHDIAPEAVLYEAGKDDGAAGNALGRPLPVAGLSAPPRHGGGLVGKLLVAACLSALLATGVLFFRLEQIDAELGKAVATARQAALPTLALKTAAVDFSRVLDLIAREKAAVPTPLAVLTALTNLLPDDAWAVQVAIRGDEVTLEGRSTASSATLIGLLENGAMFESVTFRAPVTRDTTQRFERFNIQLKLAGQGAASREQR